MFAKTFIRLVEDEYTKMMRETEKVKLQNELQLPENRTCIHETVQKFRSWFTIALRCADLVHNGAGIKPEDAVIHAAVACHEDTNSEPLHPCILSALRLFDRSQIDGLFGERRRLMLEQKTSVAFSNEEFHACYPHCISSTESA